MPRDILALFGANDLNIPYESGRSAHSPKNILIHNDWNHLTDSFDADVSLLQFDEGIIQFSTYIQPICLLDPASDPTETEGTVTGWGKSEDPTKIHENKPKLITVQIQMNEDCFLDKKTFVDLSSKRTFCAGLKNGSGVCGGDSGGGLFIKIDDVFFLRGIVSSSLLTTLGECDTSQNAVYTDVLKFRNWINEKAGEVGVTGEDDIFLSKYLNLWCFLQLAGKFFASTNKFFLSFLTKISSLAISTEPSTARIMFLDHQLTPQSYDFILSKTKK